MVKYSYKFLLILGIIGHRVTQQFPTHPFDIDIAGLGKQTLYGNINANPTGQSASGDCGNVI